jgi:hypothetical protein
MLITVCRLHDSPDAHPVIVALESVGVAAQTAESHKLVRHAAGCMERAGCATPILRAARTFWLRAAGGEAR